MPRTVDYWSRLIASKRCSRHRVGQCSSRLRSHTAWTHCCPSWFSARTTGLPRNLTFAHAGEKVGQGQSGRSCVPTDDREKFGAERLHPMVANRRCRPSTGIRRCDLALPKLPAEPTHTQPSPRVPKREPRPHPAGSKYQGRAAAGVQPQSTSWSCSHVLARSRVHQRRLNFPPAARRCNCAKRSNVWASWP